MTAAPTPADDSADRDDRIDWLRAHAATAEDPAVPGELAFLLIDRYEQNGDPADLDEVIALGQRTRLSGTGPDADLLRLHVGIAHYFLAMSTSDQSHVDSGIALLTPLVDADPLSPDLLFEAVALAELLIAPDDWLRPDAESDLNRAISLLTRVYEHWAGAPEDRLVAADLLARCLAESVRVFLREPTARLARAERALALFAEVRERYSDEDFAADPAGSIGLLHAQRYYLSGADEPAARAAMDAAIEHLTLAAEAAPDFPIVFELAELLNFRSFSDEAQDDLDLAIKWLRVALPLGDGDIEATLECHEMLGMLLCCRLETSGDRADLEAGIASLTAARDLLPRDNEQRLRCVGMLALAYALRGGDFSPQEVRDRAIALRELTSAAWHAEDEQPAFRLDFASSTLLSVGAVQEWRAEHDEALVTLRELASTDELDVELRRAASVGYAVAVAVRSTLELRNGIVPVWDEVIAAVDLAVELMPDALEPALIAAVCHYSRALPALAMELDRPIDPSEIDLPAWFSRPEVRSSLHRSLAIIDAGPTDESGDLAADLRALRGVVEMSLAQSMVGDPNAFDAPTLDRIIANIEVGISSRDGDEVVQGMRAIAAGLRVAREQRLGDLDALGLAVAELRRLMAELPSGHAFRSTALSLIAEAAGRLSVAGHGSAVAGSGIDAYLAVLALDPTDAVASMSLDGLARAVLVEFLTDSGGMRADGAGRALLHALQTTTSVEPGQQALRKAALGALLAARWRTDRDPADLREGMELLVEVCDEIPADHRLRGQVLYATAQALIFGALLFGRPAAVDLAVEHLRAARGLLRTDAAAHVLQTAPELPAQIDQLLGQIRHARDLAGDVESSRLPVLELMLGLGRMPDNETRKRSGTNIVGLMTVAAHAASDDLDGARAAVTRLDPSIAGRPDDAAAATRMAHDAVRDADAEPVRAAARLAAALSVELADETERPWLLVTLGRIRLDLHAAGEAGAAAAAVECLEAALERAPADPSARRAAAMIALATSYRARDGEGDLGRAVSTGRAALRDYGEAALIAADSDEALMLARAANEHLALLLDWAVEAGDTTAVLALLEAGRGLLLQAATMSVSVPHFLRRTGHHELAEAWSAGDRDPDLRARALTALGTTFTGLHLRALPSEDRLGAAAWMHGSDGLIYWFPPGRAATAGR